MVWQGFGSSYACLIAFVCGRAMAENLEQLSTLLGREVKQLRITDETPPRISVIDVAVAITAHGAGYASQSIRCIWQKYPEVREKITDFKFPGRG